MVNFPKGMIKPTQTKEVAFFLIKTPGQIENYEGVTQSHYKTSEVTTDII